VELIKFLWVEFQFFTKNPSRVRLSHLADLKDLFYSTEKLREVMNKVDGITVAYALAVIADKLDLKQSY
jgi:hypothetical protein